MIQINISKQTIFSSFLNTVSTFYIYYVYECDKIFFLTFIFGFRLFWTQYLDLVHYCVAVFDIEMDAKLLAAKSQQDRTTGLHPKQSQCLKTLGRVSLNFLVNYKGSFVRPISLLLSFKLKAICKQLTLNVLLTFQNCLKSD
jgi:hypothetical protein